MSLKYYNKNVGSVYGMDKNVSYYQVQLSAKNVG